MEQAFSNEYQSDSSIERKQHKPKQEKPKQAMRKNKISTKIISYMILLLLTCVTIVPFLFALSTALKGENDAIFSIPPQLIPTDIIFNNFITVWNTLPIPKYLINSAIITFFGVVLPLILSSFAAFPLARMKFKGKNFVFLIIIATMMIPNEVTMIPIYLIINTLELRGTYTGVILPSAISVLGIFLMRQGFQGIPREVEESAIIDGANVWQIFWRIMFPMVKPMLGVLAILSFIGAWNSFLWPLLILDDPNKYPITLGLYQLQGAFSANTRLVAAGSMIALFPILIVFIAFQRYFIEAAYSSAVKG